MGSLEKRLDNLERLSARRRAGKWSRPPGLDSYFRALENLDREEAGLPPLSYTEEDRRDDRDAERRARRQAEEDHKRQQEDKEKRSDQLKESWRRNHPSEEDEKRPKRGPPA
jgi:hypothetical protein